MKILFCYFLIYAGGLFSQGTGTLSDPFLILGQALTVPSAGIYYFNLGGTSFNTYVDEEGYVQVARDFGNGIGSLPQSTSLNNTSRGILVPDVLATLSVATDAKVTTTVGSNVVTTNAEIISRIANNKTLHRGSADNAINNGWVGTNAGRFTSNAACTSPNGTVLHQNIFHPCGNATTFHWIPVGSFQRDPWSSGEVPNSASFALWVRDNSSPLPIELMDFGIIKGKNALELFWTTSSERNNDFFQIEKSKNGLDWVIVGTKKGAGNSVKVINYKLEDDFPFYGLSYYRLKQVDFNGEFYFSDIKSVDFNLIPQASLSVFPNPANKFVTVRCTSLEDLKITNSIGLTMNISGLVSKLEGCNIRIDISSFEPSLYFISSGVQTIRITKI